MERDGVAVRTALIEMNLPDTRFRISYLSALLGSLWGCLSSHPSSGEVLTQALQDLTALPPDAWEREAAVEPLVAFRIQIPETDAGEEERRLLMATEELYEQWKQRMLQQGIQQGAEQALVAVYEARFGSVPPEIRVALERVATEPDPFPRWAALVATRSEREIADTLITGAPPPAPRQGATPKRPPARSHSR